MKLYVICLFICFVPLGVITHELGHFLGAKILGYKAEIHYNRTSFYNSSASPDTQAALIIKPLSGIIVTVVIGCCGFFFMLVKRDSKNLYKVLFYLTLTMFWSREIVVLIRDFVVKDFLYTTEISDERFLSVALGLPEYALSVFLGIAGITICSFSVFVMLPFEYRLFYIVNGFLGSFIGFLFWFKLLGPLILP